MRHINICRRQTWLKSKQRTGVNETLKHKIDETLINKILLVEYKHSTHWKVHKDVLSDLEKLSAVDGYWRNEFLAKDVFQGTSYTFWFLNHLRCLGLRKIPGLRALLIVTVC